jgi:hypothetical protein
MLIGCISSVSAKCYIVENIKFYGKINYIYFHTNRKDPIQEMAIIYNNKNKDLLKRDFEELDINIPKRKVKYYLNYLKEGE